MIADKGQLLAIIDNVERGLIMEADMITLRRAIERLDEMDDLVDTVCSCRTQDIPVVRAVPHPDCVVCEGKGTCHACM
jgi:hypothetical protein